MVSSPPLSDEQPTLAGLSQAAKFLRSLGPGDIFNVPMAERGRTFTNLGNGDKFNFYKVWGKYVPGDPETLVEGHFTIAGMLRPGSCLAAATHLTVEMYPGTDKWSICSKIQDYATLPLDHVDFPLTFDVTDMPAVYVFLTYGTIPLCSLANP